VWGFRGHLKEKVFQTRENWKPAVKKQLQCKMPGDETLSRKLIFFFYFLLFIFLCGLFEETNPGLEKRMRGKGEIIRHG